MWVFGGPLRNERRCSQSTQRRRFMGSCWRLSLVREAEKLRTTLGSNESQISRRRQRSSRQFVVRSSDKRGPTASTSGSWRCCARRLTPPLFCPYACTHARERASCGEMAATYVDIPESRRAGIVRNAFAAATTILYSRLVGING